MPMTSSAIRFSDVHLGTPVPVTGSADAVASPEEQVRRMVLAWSGSDRADIVSLRKYESGSNWMDFAGRVVARHISGSRCADIEVIGRDRDRICMTAIVRVALG